MADVAPAGVEKSLDDFFAKRDKKKKKEKVKGKEQATGGTVMVLKKTKREKEKSTKSENQDAQMEKVVKKHTGCVTNPWAALPRLANIQTRSKRWAMWAKHAVHSALWQLNNNNKRLYV